MSEQLVANSVTGQSETFQPNKSGVNSSSSFTTWDSLSIKISSEPLNSCTIISKHDSNSEV